jgi:hypothetical protein
MGGRPTWYAVCIKTQDGPATPGVVHQEDQTLTTATRLLHEARGRFHVGLAGVRLLLVANTITAMRKGEMHPRLRGAQQIPQPQCDCFCVRCDQGYHCGQGDCHHFKPMDLTIPPEVTQ